MQTRRLPAVGQVAALRCVCAGDSRGALFLLGATSPSCSLQAAGQTAWQGLCLIPPLGLPTNASPRDVPSGGLGCYQTICSQARLAVGGSCRRDVSWPWASEANPMWGDTSGHPI